MSVTNLAKRRGEMLDEIMAHHREQLPRTMQEVPFEDLRAMATVAPRPRDFEAAVRASGVSLIAECKKASPSKGLLVRNYDPVRLARLYEKAGARAISVLTDARHFQGARRDIVLLNAAAVLSLETGDWSDGLARAARSLDSGAALQTLDNWVAMTNSFAAG